MTLTLVHLFKSANSAVSSDGGGARIAGLITSLAYLSVIVRAILIAGRLPLRADSAFYQHAGWYITQGAVPYVSFWDPKPPLNFTYALLVAHLGGGEPLAVHVLHLILNGGIVVGVSILLAKLTTQLTEEPVAGAVAGVSPIILPGWIYFAVQGYRPKYLLIFFGLAGLLLAYQERYTSAAMASVLAAGFWHGGILFVALTLGVIIDRTLFDKKSGLWNAVKSALLGYTLGALAVFGPILYWGTVREMIIEMVLPLVIIPGETSSLPLLLFKGVKGFGFGSVFFLVGVYGLVRVAPSRFRSQWWVVIGATVSVLQVFILDFDNVPDLFLGLVFLSIGIGLVAAYHHSVRRVICVGLSIIIMFNVVLSGGMGIMRPSMLPDGDPEDVSLVRAGESLADSVGIQHGTQEEDSKRLPQEYRRSYMETIYWEQVSPPGCHYRVGGMHLRWIQVLNKSLDERTCGSIPPGADVPGWARVIAG